MLVTEEVISFKTILCNAVFATFHTDYCSLIYSPRFTSQITVSCIWVQIPSTQNKYDSGCQAASRNSYRSLGTHSVVIYGPFPISLVKWISASNFNICQFDLSPFEIFLLTFQNYYGRHVVCAFDPSTQEAETARSL